jgi:hypothetical protein
MAEKLLNFLLSLGGQSTSKFILPAILVTPGKPPRAGKVQTTRITHTNIAVNIGEIQMVNYNVVSRIA